MILTMMFAMAAAGSVSAQTVPTSYEAGHFYATPHTVSGKSMRLLVDTGGGGAAGMYWITDVAAKRLGLKTSSCVVDGDSLTVAAPPAYVHGMGLPPSAGACAGKLLVNEASLKLDGQLGGAYLGQRVWTFNYPARQLSVEAGDWRPKPAARPSLLGFRKDAKGEFPRIVVRIDGQAFNMLLDTGATAFPTEEGKRIAGTETVGGEGVTSYVTNEVLQRWHASHPDWRVVDKGDALPGGRFTARLIRVPTLEIAGWSVGPVWFTERPTKDFHNTLDDLMDAPPDGAIGGNVLQRFVMTLDYPHAKAWFQCSSGCVPADSSK